MNYTDKRFSSISGHVLAQFISVLAVPLRNGEKNILRRRRDLSGQSRRQVEKPYRVEAQESTFVSRLAAEGSAGRKTPS
jgi:hypothetical protein